MTQYRKAWRGLEVGRKIIEAIMAALKKGFRVELSMGPDGTVKVQTVSRKTLKIK